MKLKKTFRIEEDAYSILLELSDEWGISQGAAVERAIRDARQSPDDCQTDGGMAPVALGALVSQLEEKDRQIERLQDALNAEQVLHARSQERRRGFFAELGLRLFGDGRGEGDAL